MDRMEYDPEGGNYLPVTEHETGATLIVAGFVLLLAGMAWLLFVGWDIRAGGSMMRAFFFGDVVLALFLITMGFIKKKRQIN